MSETPKSQPTSQPASSSAPSDYRDMPVPTATTRPMVKVLVGLLLALIIVFGAVMWISTHRGGPERDLAEQFIRDISAGNAAAAKAVCTSDVDFEKLQRTADRIPEGWGQIRTISLPAVKTRTVDGKMRTDIAGSIEYEKLSKSFSGSVIKAPDGSYKIIAYSFD